jgi:hypothetical protein
MRRKNGGKIIKRFVTWQEVLSLLGLLVAYKSTMVRSSGRIFSDSLWRGWRICRSW